MSDVMKAGLMTISIIGLVVALLALFVVTKGWALVVLGVVAIFWCVFSACLDYYRG